MRLDFIALAFKVTYKEQEHLNCLMLLTELQQVYAANNTQF